MLSCTFFTPEGIKYRRLDADQTGAPGHVPESPVDSPPTHAELDRPTMDVALQTPLTKLRDQLTDRWLELRADGQRIPVPNWIEQAQMAA